jgi:hypothetical protein
MNTAIILLPLMGMMVSGMAQWLTAIIQVIKNGIIRMKILMEIKKMY